MAEVITPTDLALHERVTRNETMIQSVNIAIKELAQENKKSAEITQKQSSQIEQLTVQVKNQGAQWEAGAKKMNNNFEALGKRVTKYAIAAIVIITIGILFNSPEKIPSIVHNFISIF